NDESASDEDDSTSHDDHSGKGVSATGDDAACYDSPGAAAVSLVRVGHPNLRAANPQGLRLVSATPARISTNPAMWKAASGSPSNPMAISAPNSGMRCMKMPARTPPMSSTPRVKHR